MIDLTGQRFGRLMVLHKERAENGLYWNCICTCGKTSIVYRGNLTAGRTKSCGCGQGDGKRKHGQYQSRTYTSWCEMIARCYNPKKQAYRWYGALGVTVCDRWLGPNGFSNFISDMGERPIGKTIDRLESSKNYFPSNCRWATAQEQIANRRPNGSVTKRRKHGRA
jgi:hypothetical protein